MIIRALASFWILLIGTSIQPALSVPWSQAQHNRFLSLVPKNPLTPHSYPVDQESVLQQFPDRRVPIFAYGSLLYPPSASRTLPEAAYRPAVAYGVTKIFNRHVPGATHWGKPRRDNDTAMLNLIPSNLFTTGVLHYADEEEFHALLARERGYDLYPVPILLWDDPADPVWGYAFAARQERYIKRTINPIPNYYFASKKGASRYGGRFSRLWVATTLLADEETSLAEWELNPEIDMNGSN